MEDSFGPSNRKPEVKWLKEPGNVRSCSTRSPEGGWVSGLVGPATPPGCHGPRFLPSLCSDKSVLISPEAGSRVADTVPGVTSRREPETISPQGSPLGARKPFPETRSSYPHVPLTRVGLSAIVETITDQGLKLP